MFNFNLAPIIILLVLIGVVISGIIYFRNKLNIMANYPAQFKLVIVYVLFLIVSMFAYMLFITPSNIDEEFATSAEDIDKIKGYTNNIEELGMTQELPEEFLKRQWETEMLSESYSLKVSIHSLQYWLNDLFIIVEETASLKGKVEASLYQLPTVLTSPFITELGDLDMMTTFEVKKTGIVIENLDERNEINFEGIDKPFVLNQFNRNKVTDDYWGRLVGGEQILYIKVPDGTKIEVDEYLESQIKFK